MGGTARKALGWGAGLIALYLVVANATGFGTDVTQSANGASTVAKTLQGR